MKLPSSLRVAVACALLSSISVSASGGATKGSGVAASASASASVAVAVAVTVAIEESPADRASKLRVQGNEAMLGMRYADALASYQAAAELTPGDASLFYSLARAEQLVGDYPSALDALERFDRDATPAMKAKVGSLDGLYAQIRPRVATLRLTCAVAGARVIVRDKVIGVTPLPAMRLLSGAATVQVELDGFFASTSDVTLPGAGELALTIDLHRKSTSGLLTVRTEPIGASVFVDGHASGTTSPRIELALPAGAHEVAVKRDGYDDARVPLVLAPGATRDLSIPMSLSVPVTSKWWFWTTVGVAVAGGIVLTYALTTEKGSSRGTLGTVSGP